ncbi:acetoacetate decarboxylase [Diaporthe helianthi]|uniref:Acetoacetate decarboxylase n=1 Tax=Diaporthe helianthi TaxID=158607 RepID=A0A2P5HEH1_DIAHE|nr:acetoacetate decarboxylase [Diaporthe helianthi]
MPFGKRPVSNDSVPQHSPPYVNRIFEFRDVTVLTVRYRTSFASISDLVPDVLEIEDEPLVTATLLDYGTSPSKPFKEFIHTVEAKYLGKSYEFCLALILDNEIGVLNGREPTGFPKRLGNLSFIKGASNGASGHVERPAGQKLVEFVFEAKAKQVPVPRLDRPFLNLRVIPSPILGAPASVKEFVPLIFEIKPEEVWEGTGKLTFPEDAPFVESVNKIEVLRYESSTLAYGSTCILGGAERVFPL